MRRKRRHQSVPARRENWRQKCQQRFGVTWPTITQCRYQWRNANKQAKRPTPTTEGACEP